MSVVKYYPSEKDKDLQDVCEKNKRSYLSAKVNKKNEDGTVNITVCIPDGPNVNRENVSSEKNKNGNYIEKAA